MQCSFNGTNLVNVASCVSFVSLRLIYWLERPVRAGGYGSVGTLVYGSAGFLVYGSTAALVRGVYGLNFGGVFLFVYITMIS